MKCLSRQTGTWPSQTKQVPPSSTEQVVRVIYSSSVSGGDGSIRTPHFHQGQRHAWMALGCPGKCVGSNIKGGVLLVPSFSSCLPGPMSLGLWGLSCYGGSWMMEQSKLLILYIKEGRGAARVFRGHTPVTQLPCTGSHFWKIPLPSNSTPAWGPGILHTWSIDVVSQSH